MIKNRYFKTNLPTIVHVVLTPKKNDSFFWLSPELEHAITKTLANNQQVLLFLNKKGLFCFVQCSSCDYIFTCLYCSCFYTLYDNNILKCHRCNHVRTFPEYCFSCKAGKHMLIKKGVGTQQLTKHIQKQFPYASTIQLDLSAIHDKKEWNQTIERINKREYNIIIGTQLIARGYHFPHVSTVGIIWADMMLQMPKINACEAMIQSCIQVSGRAGRELGQGCVYIQTINNGKECSFFHEADYMSFYQYEIEFRKLYSFPPFSKMTTIVCRHDNEAIVQGIAQRIYQTLEVYKNNNAYTEDQFFIYEPSKGTHYKVKNMYTYVITIRSDTFEKAIKGYYTAKKESNDNDFLFFVPHTHNIF